MPQAPPDRRPADRALVAAAGCAIFAWALFRTAWMCDDAFITLRTVDNFVHGYGLRWNVDERVQAFTHPLWLLLLTPFYAITREPYLTTLAAQAALAIATMWLLLRHAATTTNQAWLAIAVLVSSKAFVDFSTSGLENPLTHLLIVLFFLVWRSDRWRSNRSGVLTLLACCVVLSRPDLAVLIAPVLITVWLTDRFSPRAMLLGATPLIAWEIFSLVYYGSPVPNTALAKLSTGVPASDLLVQGWYYLAATYALDPMTILLLAGSLMLVAIAYGAPGRLMALGALLHLLFVLRSGGDFMSGRFLTAPLLWTVAGVVGLPFLRAAEDRRRFTVAAALIAAMGLIITDAPPLISLATFGSVPPSYVHGVVDERQVYYPTMGLLRRLGFAPMEQDQLAVAGDLARRTPQPPRLVKVVGVFGYFAGPGLHIVDEEALCDPFLARLAAKAGWRPGHFEREVPEEYLKSLREHTNALTDPQQHALYDDVRLATQSPIWSEGRLGAIWRLTLRR